MYNDYFYLHINTFLQSLITVNVLIAGFLILRKSKKIYRMSGFFSPFFLFFACFVRMVFPASVNRWQVGQITDPYILPFLATLFYNRVPADSIEDSIVLSPLFYVLLTVFLAGSVIFAFFFTVFYVRSYRKYSKIENKASPRDIQIFNKVKQNVFKNRDRRIYLFVSEEISAPVSMGLFCHKIYLPKRKYSDTELNHILTHECVHIRNGDNRIKLFSYIFVILLWWNPFSYLLLWDLDGVLEAKCDSYVTRKYSEAQKLEYLETMLSCMRWQKNQKQPLGCCFTGGHSKKNMLRRFDKLITVTPKLTFRIWFNFFVSLTILVTFICSYLFTWVPSTDVLKEIYANANPATSATEIYNGD